MYVFFYAAKFSTIGLNAFSLQVCKKILYLLTKPGIHSKMSANGYQCLIEKFLMGGSPQN